MLRTSGTVSDAVETIVWQIRLVVELALHLLVSPCDRGWLLKRAWHGRCEAGRTGYERAPKLRSRDASVSATAETASMKLELWSGARHTLLKWTRGFGLWPGRRGGSLGMGQPTREDGTWGDATHTLLIWGVGQGRYFGLGAGHCKRAGTLYSLAARRVPVPSAPPFPPSSVTLSRLVKNMGRWMV